jgi:hypothetical protein
MSPLRWLNSWLLVLAACQALGSALYIACGTTIILILQRLEARPGPSWSLTIMSYCTSSSMDFILHLPLEA